MGTNLTTNRVNRDEMWEEMFRTAGDFTTVRAANDDNLEVHAFARNDADGIALHTDPTGLSGVDAERKADFEAGNVRLDKAHKGYEAARRLDIVNLRPAGRKPAGKGVEEPHPNA